MAFFKKKLSDDERDEIDDLLDGEDDGEKRSIKRKKIKDLHPENKKKRKEPPKPWGKKERVLVFIILAATAGISAYLLITSSGFALKKPEIKMPELNKFSLPDIKFERTIIIENDRK